MKKKFTYLIAILLIVITCIAFNHIGGNDFISFDDGMYVSENKHVQSGINLDSIQWAFTTRHFGLWNPMVWISLMIDYQFFGLNAGGYHLTNLFFHILSTLLLFWLFHRMTGAVWRSAFVAALFALHPLHVESVAWVAERKGILSGFFWMLTLCFYVYYTEKPDMKRYILVIFAFMLALMSKPMVVTLPVIMMLLDYWPLNRFASEKGRWIIWQIKEKTFFFILSLILIIVTLYNPYQSSQELFSLSTRISNAIVSCVIYLEKTFWPYNFAVFYPFPVEIPIWQIAGALILIIMISTVVIVTAKQSEYLFVGWFWYLITIFPVLGIIQISYTTPYAMADRYTYLPSIGIAIMLSWGIPSLIKSEGTRKYLLFPAAIFVLTVAVYLTWQQCGYWKTNFTLFDQALRVTKGNYLAYAIRGNAYNSLGQYQQAIKDSTEAIRLNPYYSKAYFVKGVAYARLGQYQRAIEEYDKGIRIRSNENTGYGNRGNAYYELGQYQFAISDYNEAIKLKPDVAEGYGNRGNAYFKLKQYQQAIADYSQAIRLNPDYADAYYNRGTSYARLGQYRLAVEDYSKTIALKKNFIKACNNRGIVYYKLGLYQQAIVDYSQAIRLNPAYAEAYHNRSVAYLEQNIRDLGCRDAQKACDLGNCELLTKAQNKGICNLAKGGILK